MDNKPASNTTRSTALGHTHLPKPKQTFADRMRGSTPFAWIKLNTQLTH
ncbi:hypothetical protein [Deefgea salmonis]|uniref:Uncharacterized protein n=1 Tax=Deefgea salmonis TaxID=2875502 RepID=A0ABS8BGD4_9NEIS|nr:hypothetical protein [Deefgea salmonis]MCB5194768.1 hypothetical protein [Deefgea salmonis]